MKKVYRDLPLTAGAKYRRILDQLALLTTMDSNAASADDPERVTLSSVHQAKGLEWKVVYHKTVAAISRQKNRYGREWSIDDASIFAQIDAIHLHELQSAPLAVPGSFLIADELHAAARPAITNAQLRLDRQIRLIRAFRVRRHLGCVDIFDPNGLTQTDDRVAVDRMAIRDRLSEGRGGAGNHDHQHRQQQQR
jgi:hypothetical protein